MLRYVGMDVFVILVEFQSANDAVYALTADEQRAIVACALLHLLMITPILVLLRHPWRKSGAGPLGADETGVIDLTDLKVVLLRVHHRDLLVLWADAKLVVDAILNLGQHLLALRFVEHVIEGLSDQEELGIAFMHRLLGA